MKKRVVKLVAFAAALGVLGALVAASGVVPIRASGGHWRVTEWILHFSMQRSVRARAMSTVVPSLDDPALVLRGAEQYDLACAPCHGSPSRPPPGVVHAMTPPPPFLPPALPQWSPAALFEIVKHGVKLTGMPAWPTQQRDDEVWAMVAFLRVLPGLDDASYRRLVDGEGPTAGEGAPLRALPGTTLPPSVIENCVHCHGARGEGRGGAFPAIAGQRPGYALAALEAYARGARHSGIMGPIAAELPPADRRALATYYATLPAPARAPHADDGSIARGAQIARHGVATQHVPACVRCHGPGEAARNPTYPRLAGQEPGYLALQLDLFKQERRGGGAYAPLMRAVTRSMTDAQMRDVARYYASLPPERSTPDGD